MFPTVRQLEAFTLVYELGSVTQAAIRMNLTQSTVSVLLRQLEHNVGMPLFDRTTRVLSPTSAADDILPFAERALREIEQVGRTAQNLLTKSSGRVRLAASAALAASALPRIISGFTRRYPAIEISLHDMAPSKLNRALLHGEVDFGVGGRPDTLSPELHYECIRSCSLVAARRADDIPRSDTVSWEELAREPAVIGIRRASAIRKRIDRELEPFGLAFSPTLESELVSTAIALAVEGLGVAVLPEDLIGRQHHRQLSMQRLVQPEILHDLFLIYRPAISFSPATEAFVEEIRRVIGGNAVSVHDEGGGRSTSYFLARPAATEDS